MNIPHWICHLADSFWQAVGFHEPFPRTLRTPILRGPFELTIKEFPALSVSHLERYLQRLGTRWVCPGPDRALRGCLVAVSGVGLIGLDARDSPEERTFSLAHELAHFLAHFFVPRTLAVRRFGPAVDDILEGRRCPTAAEQVCAMVAGVSLKPHVHLMNRERAGAPEPSDRNRAEAEADRLAMELLAPVESVAKTVLRIPVQDWPKILEATYGLPATKAREYGTLLAPPPEDRMILRLRNTDA